MLRRLQSLLTERRLRLPPAPALLVVLALAFTLPGLLGHDPWKTDDAIGTGIVSQMLRNGQWLLPHLAGEPFLEDGPLHYWIGSAFAWAASPLLALHDGARLASGAIVLAALFLLRLVARELAGEAEGDAALLVLLGSLGLMVHAHENLAEVSQLAGLALALYAIAIARRRAGMGGALLGVGWAVALLAKGLAALAIGVLAAIAVPVLCTGWRHRRYAAALAIASGAAAFLCGLWLAGAFLNAPPDLEMWAQYQFASVGAPQRTALADFGSTLIWAAWPAWPIALWALWAQRKTLLEPRTGFALAVMLAAAGTTFFLPSPREVDVLPLLLPLSLLAAAGVPHLRRGAANALAWFGAMTFTFLGALVWLGWVAMMTGTPEAIARNFAKLEPGHVPHFQGYAFAVALAFSLAWLALLFRSERSTFRSVTFWSAGVILAWGLVTTLWLPWIDYGKTYGPVAQGLRQAIPAGTRCIESRNLGEAQRAAFDYHAGVVTRRAEIHQATDARGRCPVLLVQGSPGENDRAAGPGWRRVWEGNRPRDRERFRLYLREK